MALFGGTIDFAGFWSGTEGGLVGLVDVVAETDEGYFLDSRVLFEEFFYFPDRYIGSFLDRVSTVRG